MPCPIGYGILLFKEEHMEKKNLLISGLVVFVVHQILDYFIHQVILAPTYEATAELWRPEDEMLSLMWVMICVGLLWSFIFTYIFGWFHKGLGIMEGIQYGFCIGLFVMVPMAFNSYVVTPIPFSLALGWFGYGMVQVIICGAVLSLVYRPSQATG